MIESANLEKGKGYVCNNPKFCHCGVKMVFLQRYISMHDHKPNGSFLIEGKIHHFCLSDLLKLGLEEVNECFNAPKGGNAVLTK